MTTRVDHLILAERLLLLALDDERGKDSTDWGGIEPGLAGALLIDLARGGFIREEQGELIAAGEDPKHPLLVEAVDAIRLSRKRRNVKGWVGRLPKELKPLKQRVARSLVADSVLSEERRSFLGIATTTRFPEYDAAPERALRERLRAVLLSEREPDENDCLLLGLLRPYDLPKTLVPRERRRQAKHAAKALAEDTAAVRAVGASVREVQVALFAAIAGSSASNTSN